MRKRKKFSLLKKIILIYTQVSFYFVLCATMIIDLIYEKLLVGGWVLIPIFLVGVFGFYILLGHMFHLGKDLYRRNYMDFFEFTTQEFKNTHTITNLKRGLVDRILHQMIEFTPLSKSDFIFQLKRIIQKEFGQLEKGVHLVNSLSSSAPMLGLLGTVIGMIYTFQVINIYGSGNPALMARGIAEALIATQAGLLIALPMIIWSQRLEDRVEWIKKQVEIGFEYLVNELYNEEQQ